MAIMPEEQNLQMQVTRLLKKENTINEMCLQILDSFRKNGCDVFAELENGKTSLL
jgi:hypothetical protein